MKKVCRYGIDCFQKNPKHLEEFTHPADEAYLHCCREEGIEPAFISVKKLFEWCDVSCSGKATKEEVTKMWPKIQALSEVDVPAMSEAMWQQIDDDGNGHVNFSEFAELTSRYKVKLPLGLDDLFTTNGVEKLCCGVVGCDCQDFKPLRCKCKYGEGCYQKSEDHRSAFAHPGDDDWDTAPRHRADVEMCQCRHKRKLHASARSGVSAVQYPADWESSALGDSDFMNFVPLGPDKSPLFQRLLDATYSDVTTRDRCNHSGGDWRVPENFKLQSVMRNENSKLWRKYAIKKADLQKERRTLDDPYQLYVDVKTSKAREDLGGDRLDPEINEWYLWHGTSESAAHNICTTDFKMRLAGSATGTLYGRGSYLAESITKADEYAKQENGCYTVLLCRVLGGRVFYTDERTPDPDKCTAACTEGDYDCIIGDREKVSGTYREFVVFDTENVFPEYILKYQRGKLFKSPSHPPG